jgi:hypothetical protein
MEAFPVPLEKTAGNGPLGGHFPISAVENTSLPDAGTHSASHLITTVITISLYISQGLQSLSSQIYYYYYY